MSKIYDKEKTVSDLLKQYDFVEAQLRAMMDDIEREGRVVLSKSNGWVQNPEIKNYLMMVREYQNIIKQLHELNMDVPKDDGLSRFLKK